MSTIKMGFSGLPALEQVERTRSIVTAMTGNPNYVTPVPSLIIMGDAATALETAWNESRNGDRVKLTIMRNRRKDLLALVPQLAAYVQSTSDGDGEKILSSGFSLRPVPLPKPTRAGDIPHLQLSIGSVSGGVMVRWAKADYAVLYAIEVSTTGTFGTERYFAITSRTQKEITGLTVGTTVWIRVRGLGKEEAGNPCGALSALVN